jgi:hypothetical protein
MQLRALMSSPDSSRSWELQCEVREQLVAYLRTEHPYALPRRRTEVLSGEGDLGSLKDLEAAFTVRR